MPERKLVKHGPSTFIVSLPKPWVDSHDFKKGDSIQYRETEDSVTYFAPSHDVGKKSKEVDLTGLDRSFIVFMIRALYRQGYGEIKLRFDNSEAKHHRTGEMLRVSSIISDEVNNLIGVEISSHGSNEIVLHQLAESGMQELKPTIDRVFSLIDGAYKTLLEALKTDDPDLLEELEGKHEVVSKFVNYSIRVLHLAFHDESRPYLMHAVMQLEAAMDILKTYSRQARLYEYEDVGGQSYKTVEILYEMHETAFKLFTTWDKNLANTMDRLREDFLASLRGDFQDSSAQSLLSILAPAVEVYRDLVVSRLSMPEDVFNKDSE